MNALAIVGCTVGGGLMGAIAGFALGLREGGDFNFAPAFYAPMGAIVGGFVGVVAGAVIFT